MSRVTHLLPTT